MFRKVLELNKSKEKRARSAMVLQRAWRGFKGRQVFEVFRALKNAQDLTQPIKDRIESLEQDRDEIAKELGLLKRRYDKAKTKLSAQGVELRTVSKIGARYFDSDSITGTRQRFETKYLREWLERDILNWRDRTEDLEHHVEETSAKLRTVEREIRKARRQLVPLERGVEERTYCSFVLHHFRPTHTHIATPLQVR